MKIAKIRNVKTPERGTGKSAGLDFFVPDSCPVVTLKPKESVNLPSGIKVKIPEGMALIAFNKSGVAVKKSLQVGACVVDEDYSGEIHLHVTNIGLKPVEINPGDKLVQFILLPVLYSEIHEMPEDSIVKLHKDSERGGGGFGSTGV